MRISFMQRRGRARRGATIVELLVALLLFDLSLLTLAAVSAVAVRRVGDAGRRNRAALAATGRLEAMMAQPCAAAASGSNNIEPGVTERWWTTTTVVGRELVDSVRIEGRQSERLVLRARTTC